MSNIGIIIGREYRERVYKKSFILTTLLMPVLMLAIAIVPTLLIMFAHGDAKRIEVVDMSGKIADRLESNEFVEFTSGGNDLQQALKKSLEDDNFGVLYVGENIIADPNDVKLYTNSSSSMTMEKSITSQISDIIEAERLKEYNINNLKEIMDNVRADVHLSTFRNDAEEGVDKSVSSAATGIVGIILGFMLYMVLVIYGSIVMQSIIEEKNSRILEVMVSTVRPFDMMMGKILGVALVALTQMLIWGVILILISAVIMPSLLPADIMSGVASIQAGATDVAAVAQMSDIEPEALTALSSLLDAGYIAGIFATFVIFMTGGFLLYAAMYAAVGASVDEIQDASQLQTPIMLPLLLAEIVLIMLLNDPNSKLAFWFSIIPFTSPIIMPARVPSGIPLWEVILSAVLLFATFAAMVWVAAKIYRIGIFMHGKKPSFKELWRWLRY